MGRTFLPHISRTNNVPVRSLPMLTICKWQLFLQQSSMLLCGTHVHENCRYRFCYRDYNRCRPSISDYDCDCDPDPDGLVLLLFSKPSPLLQ